jgi:hypothetical protein
MIGIFDDWFASNESEISRRRHHFRCLAAKLFSTENQPREKSLVRRARDLSFARLRQRPIVPARSDVSDGAADNSIKSIDLTFIICWIDGLRAAILGWKPNGASS